MQDYVLICGIHDANNKIMFIKKDRPESQKGRINLIGGKIEDKEVPEDAAYREFLEETGYNLYLLSRYGEIRYSGGYIYCFMGRIDANAYPSKRSDNETEEVFWSTWDNIKENKLIMPNLKIIVPFCITGTKNWIILEEEEKLIFN